MNRRGFLKRALMLAPLAVVPAMPIATSLAAPAEEPPRRDIGGKDSRFVGCSIELKDGDYLAGGDFYNCLIRPARQNGVS